jgi:hypothetical protein
MKGKQMILQKHGSLWSSLFSITFLLPCGACSHQDMMVSDWPLANSFGDPAETAVLRPGMSKDNVLATTKGTVTRSGGENAWVLRYSRHAPSISDSRRVYLYFDSSDELKAIIARGSYVPWMLP